MSSENSDWKISMRPKRLIFTPLVGLVLIILFTFLLAFQFELPAATGPYIVGQTVFRWADSSRPEALTENPNDFREVMALLWYPAENQTGTSSPYFPGLSTISNALVESGEVNAWEVFGLQFIRSKNLLDAKPARSDSPYPIVIFSPG